ncbi:MAG: M20/M25/M40 family metallo-hydrolase [Terriglobia bacterium]
MKWRHFVVFLLSFWVCTAVASAQDDGEIAAALKKVSAERIRADIYKLVSFGTRHTASAEASETRGVGAARRWIFSEMKKNIPASGGRLEVFEDWFEGESRRIARQRMANVVAILRGEEGKKRAYVVGGHYDSRASNPRDAESDAPGADDDGSGTAVTLELLRVMAPLKFNATLIFVAFVGEEQGLLGSTHLAEWLKNEGYEIDGMLALDIVGNSVGGSGLRDEGTVRCFSKGIADGDSISREWARYVAGMAGRYVRDTKVELIYRRDRYGRGGDHIPFERGGYPAARLSEMYENYFHQHQDVRMEGGIQYGDLPEFVDANYAARVARVAGAALMNAARAPAPPPKVTLKGAVAYDTTLAWEAVAGAAGYVVVYRKPTAARWEQGVAAGVVTSLVLKDVVADNFVFGVKSVDGAGHESRVQPAVFVR